MSINNDKFIVKHNEIYNSLCAQYENDYNICRAESEMNQGKFPAIGIFLGSAILFQDTIQSYIPQSFVYMLMVADIYDRDSYDSQRIKSTTMYNLLVDIITKMNFKVITNAEPVINIAFGESEWITGWTVMIEYKA